MDTWVWILIAVVAVLVVLGVLWYVAQQRRSRALQDRFGGSEYDRAIDKEGGRRAAERELRDREKRHEELELRPLSPEARRGFSRSGRRRRVSSSTTRKAPSRGPTSSFNV